MSDADTSDSKSWKFAIGFTLFVVAAVGIGLYLKAKHHDEEGPGELEVAHKGTLADGRAVILIVADVVHPDSEGPDTHTTRMDVIDATSGARLVRKPRMDVHDCVPAAAGLAWCVGEKNRLSVYDLATLAVVKSEDDLEKNVGVLKKGVHEQPEIEPTDGSAIVMTNDGSTWSIASAGCRTQCVAKEIKSEARKKGKRFLSRMGYRGATSDSLTGGVKLADGREVGFTSGTKQSLTIGTYDKKQPLGLATFLTPSLIVLKEKEEDSGTFRVGSEEIIIVSHVDTLDEAKAKKSFTAFDLEGRTKWTQQIGGGKLEHGFRVGDALIIAVDASAGGYVFSVSLKDGRILWRQPT